MGNLRSRNLLDQISQCQRFSRCRCQSGHLVIGNIRGRGRVRPLLNGWGKCSARRSIGTMRSGQSVTRRPSCHSSYDQHVETVVDSSWLSEQSLKSPELHLGLLYVGLCRDLLGNSRDRADYKVVSHEFSDPQCLELGSRSRHCPKQFKVCSSLRKSKIGPSLIYHVTKTDSVSSFPARDNTLRSVA